jgi:hypothetical protein
MTSIYVAGASSEMATCQFWMRKLENAGLTITHDWCAAIEKVGSANPAEATLVELLKYAELDRDGILNADVFWLLVPDGHSTGSWTELGLALYSRTVFQRPRIIVSGNWRRNIFCALADRRLDTHENAFEWIHTFDSIRKGM